MNGARRLAWPLRILFVALIGVLYFQFGPVFSEARDYVARFRACGYNYERLREHPDWGRTYGACKEAQQILPPDAAKSRNARTSSSVIRKFSGRMASLRPASAPPATPSSVSMEWGTPTASSIRPLSATRSPSSLPSELPLLSLAVP